MAETINVNAVARKASAEAVHHGTRSRSTAAGPDHHTTHSQKKTGDLADVLARQFHANGNAF